MHATQKEYIEIAPKNYIECKKIYRVCTKEFITLAQTEYIKNAQIILNLHKK